MAPCSAGGGTEEEEDEEEAPSHLPLAPPFELDDISTTVDPCYIISLIRKLLPHDMRIAEHSQKIKNNDCAAHASETCSLEHNMIIDHNCEKTTIATESTDSHHSCCNLTDRYGEHVDDHFVVQKDSSASIIDNETCKEIVEDENLVGSDDGKTEYASMKDPWEECGCVLWDLSASKTHAEFMVNNLLLEVLLVNLHASKPLRVTEICLGIIGNLACHSSPGKLIVTTNGLIERVVDQLFLDDSTCLSETFRLLGVGLQGSCAVTWAASLQSEQILLRILWIVGNTLNSTLLERSIEFLLAIVENQEIADILLQPLAEAGLPNLIVSLLECEMIKLRDEINLERCSVLDMVLRLVEALSTTDKYSQMISSNVELFHLVCDVVKLPDKIEVASSCVSAVIIIANLLVDEQHLSLELSHDFLFLKGLLDIFPFVSDTSQSREALWCILASLLVQIQENDIDESTLHQFASLFLEKSQLIEEDLDGIDSNGKSDEVASSLRRISCILEKWIVKRPVVLEERGRSEVGSLLSYCRKYNMKYSKPVMSGSSRHLPGFSAPEQPQDISGVFLIGHEYRTPEHYEIDVSINGAMEELSLKLFNELLSYAYFFVEDRGEVVLSRDQKPRC